MTTAALVSQTAEAILMLEQASRLVGSSIRVKGAERVMLVSAIRQRVQAELDECGQFALADFVPLGFAALTLTEMGVRVPEHFGRKDSRGRIREYRRLEEIDTYWEALALARAWWADRPDDVRAIAEWTGLPDLIRTAVAGGSKLPDLELIPVLLNGPDAACPPLEERPTFTERPWWLKHWEPKPWWKFW